MNYIRQPWSGLEDAYGSADGIGQLLSSLKSSDEDIWRQADYDLAGTIYHQGTLYSSTIKAIPCLVEMLFTEKDPKRECIINLLGFIGEGIGKCGIDFGKDYPYVLEEEDEISSTMEAAIEDENEVGRALEILVYLYMPLIESSIDSGDGLTRQSIAGAIGAYVSQYSHYESLLSERMKIETEEDVIEVLERGLSEMDKN